MKCKSKAVDSGNRRRLRPRGGSALLVTLLVVSLLMMVVLSLTVWVRMELRSLANHQQVHQARGNARLALIVALGELQKAAGPDQRTTATADLAARNLDGDRIASGAGPANNDPLQQGGNGRGLSAVSEGTRFWTGVWESVDDPDDLYLQAPRVRLLQWLVSGNEAGVNHEPGLTPDWGGLANGRLSLGAGGDGVVLVGGGSAGTLSQSGTLLSNFGGADPADRENYRDRWVVAPLVEINTPEGRSAGGFAYWVGDEAVKARYNLADPLEGAGNAGEQRLRARVAQRVAAEMATAGEESQPAAPPPGTPLSNTPEFVYDDYPFPGNPSNDDVAGLSRIVSNAQKELLQADTAPEALKSRFHALTLHSRGVLSDSRSGGLKQDLSFALEDTVLFNQMFADPGILPAAVSPDTGPLWQTVQTFYELADRTQETIDLNLLEPGPGVPAPVLTEIRLLFKLYPSEQSGTWHLRINVAVGLANPYTVPLRTSGLRMAFDRVGRRPETAIYDDFGPFGNSARGGWWVWALDGDLNRITSFPVLHRASPNTPPSSPWTLNGSDTSFSIPGTTWQPGELRFFAIADRTQSVTNTPGQVLALSEIANAPLETHYFAYDTGVALPVVAGGGGEPDDEADPPEYAAWLQFIRDQPWTATREPTGFSLSVYRPSDSPDVPMTRAEISSFFVTFPSEPTRFEPDLDGGITAGVVKVQMRIPFLPDIPYVLNQFQREAYPFRPIADQNLRARFQLPSPFLTSDTVFWSYFPYYGGRNNAVNDFTAGHWGGWTWGGRYHEQDNTSWPHFTPFDSPRRRHQGEPPLLSLGELQHIDLTANDEALSIGYQPGAAVGNSFHPPLLHRNLSVQQRLATAYRPNRNLRFFDISYLLNTALFDRYFFSSYPGGALEDTLPNSRFAMTGTGDFFSPLSGEVPGTSPARSLLVEGAFNVNSTHPEAWAAVLASTIRVPVDPDGLTVGTPFPRSINQPDGANLAHRGDDQDSYSGYRRLTDAEVRKLAWEMVRQVRQRGPFLSLAQFVNRTLVAADASGTDNLAPLRPPASMGLSGPLQAAIDAAGINRMPGIPDPYVKPALGDRGLNNPFWPDYERDFPALLAVGADTAPPQGSRLTGIPGYLTQADILQVLAPTLSARSDTFRIRAYGETPGQSGTRAWCEAIVQRRQEFIEPEDNPPGARPGQLSSINAAFGRKFEIIGFRWLNEDEI